MTIQKDYAIYEMTMFETDFLTPTHSAAYRDAISKAVDTLLAVLPSKAYSGKSVAELATLFQSEIFPQPDLVLTKLSTAIVRSSRTRLL